jgi:hypothetical protein
VIAPDATAGAPADAGSLHHRLRTMMSALGGMLGDRVLLLSLELRLAGRALGTIVALGVGAAVAALTAWLGLWLALGAWIVETGGSHAVAALVVIVANGALAALCLVKARGLLKMLTLPATLRTLTGAAHDDDEAFARPRVAPMGVTPEAPQP